MLAPALHNFMGQTPSAALASRQRPAEAVCSGQQLPHGMCVQAANAPAPLPAEVVRVGDGVTVSSANSDGWPARVSFPFDAATLPEPLSADSMDRMAVLMLRAGHWIECQRLALHLHMRAPYDSHVDVLATQPGYYAVVYRRPAKGIATAKGRPTSS